MSSLLSQVYFLFISVFLYMEEDMNYTEGGRENLLVMVNF